MVDVEAEVGVSDSALQVYLLGPVDFATMLRFQRRLVYDVTGDRRSGVLVLCEHPAALSIGREGSREHIGYDRAELAAREWPVRWVNRGGGVLLHAPGQLAVYPILALDRLGLDLQTYLDRLHRILIDELRRVGVPASRRSDKPGVFVENRMIAHVGIAVRDWVAYYGAAINVDTDLELFRRLQCAGANEPPMTSVQREARTPIRASSLRLRLADAFAEAFGFARTSLFHSHPALIRESETNAVVTPHR